MPPMKRASLPAHRLAIALLALAPAACGGTAPGASESTQARPDSGAPPITADAGTDAAPPSVAEDAQAPGAPDAAASGEAGGPVMGSGTTPVLPAPTGACPTFVNGTVTFSPAGIPQRSAQVYMSDAAKTMHGPLIIYWYATGSSTAEAEYSLGTTLATIEAAGGIVIAPQADPTAGMFEWFIVNQSPKLDDFLVADEIVGCAAKTTGIDTTHIHSMGMSAGALQTTAMSFLRSDYLASVTTYSGGIPAGFTPPATQDPANKLAAFIFDGGSTDDVFNVDFQAASQAYYSNFKAAGHFVAICDHGGGHIIPLDAAPSVYAFFQANGFGVSPSPYANGLPAGFPSYCTL